MRDLTFCLIAFAFAFATSAMIFRFLTGPAHRFEQHREAVSFETLERALREGRSGTAADRPPFGSLASTRPN